ncbi:MAG: LytTR family transcriptional regulator DNA-binding domain-containing protein [Erysipelothrix sp.]
MFIKIADLIIRKQDVISIECYDKKTTIHTNFGDVITTDSVSRTVAQFEDKLICVYRGIYVNPAFVKSAYRDRIVMIDGSVFYVSRRRYPEVVEKLLNYR